ncbi:MAG: hypothetical protein FJ247_05390 [Nitrospira sp.]|nr:hypothetical protein [Nitrospira sp.]
MAKRRVSATPRITITDTPDELRIVMPNRRSWFVIGMLAFWVCAWGVGEVVGSTTLYKSEVPPGEERLMLAWLVVWTVSGLAALVALQWQIMGKEIVTMQGHTLQTQREGGGIGFRKEYDVQQIANLRVEPPKFSPFDVSASFQLWGIGGGVIAFESGGNTRRFGAGLDDAEAKQVVDALKRRCRVAERSPK